MIPEDRRAWGYVAFGALAYTCLMFIWFSLPAFLTPITAELGLSGTEAGILVGTVPLTYVPFALVTGTVVDRVGPGRTIGAGVLCYACGQLLRSGAAGLPSLLVGTIVIGIGATTVTFGLPKLVAILFPAERTGAPSSLYLIGASIGSATVFATGRPLLAPLLGDWRAVFFWSGIVALGYATAWIVVTTATNIDDAVGGADAGIRSLREDLALVLGHRELQWLVVVGSMYLLLNHGLQGWLPSVLEGRGMSPGRAGGMTSVLVLSLAMGTLTVPPIADRLRARRGALIGCGGIIMCGVSAIGVFDIGIPLVAAVVLTGVGIGGVAPLLRAIPPALDGLGSRLTATAVAFIFAVGEIGGFVGPFAIGALYDVTGTYVAGLAMLVGGGAVIVGAASRLEPV